MISGRVYFGRLGSAVALTLLLILSCTSAETPGSRENVRHLGMADWSRSLAFSPDGGAIAAGDARGRIVLWDVTSGSRKADLILGGDERSQSPVVSVSFSPDGSRLAAAGPGKAIHIWDVRNRKLERDFVADGDHEVFAAAISPDGKTLLGTDGAVHAWDLASGQLIFKLSHEEEILSIAFSPDSRRFAARSLVRPLRVFDASTGKVIATCEDSMPKERPEYLATWGIAFSPSGKEIVSAIDGGRVGLWEVESGRKARELKSGDPFCPAISLSPDGRRLAAVTLGSHLVLRDLREYKVLRRLAVKDRWSPHNAIRATVAFSPDGSFLAASTLAADEIVLFGLMEE